MDVGTSIRTRNCRPLVLGRRGLLHRAGRDRQNYNSIVSSDPHRFRPLTIWPRNQLAGPSCFPFCGRQTRNGCSSTSRDVVANDAEQGMIEAARRIRILVKCAVIYVHYAGKEMRAMQSVRCCVSSYKKSQQPKALGREDLFATIAAVFAFAALLNTN